MGSGYERLKRWRYGNRIEGYDMGDCETLVRNRRYGLVVYASGGRGEIFFVLDETGAIRVLHY